MRNFDIVAIDPIVDWFNIMTYDLHGTWDSTDKAIGSVVLAHTNITEIQQAGYESLEISRVVILTRNLTELRAVMAEPH